jgi:predicted ArsR family transcriptional regulator
MPPASAPHPTSRQDEVLRELKQSGPLPVRELAAKLELSYMGAKQHCLALEKRGLLSSRNNHRGAGRPLLVYSLTSKGQSWFEETDNTAAISILRNAKNLFGSNSAAKLLLLYFQECTEKYRSQVPAQTPVAKKMDLLAKARDEEGRMVELIPGVRIIERHNPSTALHKAFPEADALEESLFRQVLGVPIRRRVISPYGQYEIHFDLHTPLAIKS